VIKTENQFYNSPEWARLRACCLRRDGYKCRDCGSIDNLQAHHLSTFNYRNPDIDCLVTLCKDCHEKRHEEQKRVEESALRNVGELQDRQMYRMYLTDARINICFNGPYIACKFSRFVNGRSECSMAIFNSNQASKFLAACNYRVYDIDVDMSTDNGVNEIYERIINEIGTAFDLRVSLENGYWNVKPNEIYPVV
jgi:hypothetical protein